MAGGSSSKKKRRSARRRNPATDLTDDLLVEILSPTPYRPLCRFRCVSERWRALISQPDHSRRLPHSLVGFFYTRWHAAKSNGLLESGRHFANVSMPTPVTGHPFVDTSFSFLPTANCPTHLLLLVSCNGLLLFRSFEPGDRDEFSFIVLNPATEKWVAVPVSERWSNEDQPVRLGFDPAVYSHFHLFMFQVDWVGNYGMHEYMQGGVIEVDIYSSKTGIWNHKQSGWSHEISIRHISQSVFLGGMLYMVPACSEIAAVDVEGKTWRIFDMSTTMPSFFCESARFIPLILESLAEWK